MNCGIYKISNTIDDRIYIGSAKDFKIRWSMHKSSLRRVKHKNPYLQNFINKHSIQILVFESIEFCEESELLIREQWYLDNIIRWNYDFNIAKEASAPMMGRFHTESSKKLMSDKAKGVPKSEEAKKNMSESRKGRKVSEKALQNMKIARNKPELLAVFEKPINQYTLEGIFIRTWKSASDVHRELSISFKNISQCLKGDRRIAGGYYWKYYIGTTDDIEPCRDKKTTGKNTCLIDDEGNIIKVYKSNREAAIDLNLHQSNVSSVAIGKLKHTKGYKFKYLDNG